MHKRIVEQFAISRPGAITLWIVICALFLLVVTVRYKNFSQKGIHVRPVAKKRPKK